MWRTFFSETYSDAMKVVSENTLAANESEKLPVALALAFSRPCEKARLGKTSNTYSL
jgi:hypothetical protein